MRHSNCIELQLDGPERALMYNRRDREGGQTDGQTDITEATE